MKENAYTWARNTERAHMSIKPLKHKAHEYWQHNDGNDVDAATFIVTYGITIWQDI